MRRLCEWCASGGRRGLLYSRRHGCAVTAGGTMNQHTSTRTIADFFTGISDPSFFAGGGSVAAIAAAGAASTAILVMRLNERRKANASRRPELQFAIARVEALIQEFYNAADADIATLDRL